MDKLTYILLFSLGASLLMQLYFWLIVLKKAGKQSGTAETKEERAISIVVCAYNEFENLQRLIPKLIEQKHAVFEIIIVNDRSTDSSLAYLESIKDQRFRFITITKTLNGFDHKKYALQEGIKKARYDYVLLTDADCVPKSVYWVNEMQKRLATKEVVLGLSFYEKRKGLLNHFIQFETYYTALQYLGFANNGMPYMGVGRNLLYKKSLFIKNAEFEKVQNHKGGDDDLLLQQFSTRENTTTCILPNGQTLSLPKETLKEWFIQKTRHLNAGKSYPQQIVLKLALLQSSHLVFYVSLLLLFFFISPFVLLVVFLLRNVVLFSIFDRTSKQFGNQLTKKEIVFGDFVYVIYFFVTSIYTLFKKTFKWK